MELCNFATILMKVLTYILALTVIFLSVEPGIDAIPFSSDNQKTCCSSSKCSPISDKQNSDNNSDKEENGMCNPFQACGSCSLLCLTMPFQSLLNPEISTEQFFEYKSFIPSQFITDFWQPPKSV